MRIRKPFAGAFAGLILVAAYLGLAPRHYETPNYGRLQGDKVLHFFTFFILTLTFYWIVETSRRKVMQLTLGVCTGALAAGSEIIQGLLPNGREFDILDIAANVAGSGAALAICAWYHRRMLERKRSHKRFGAAGDEEAGLQGDGVELDENTGAQETGVTSGTARVEAELDNWDENAEDWDEGDAPAKATKK